CTNHSPEGSRSPKRAVIALPPESQSKPAVKLGDTTPIDFGTKEMSTKSAGNVKAEAAFHLAASAHTLIRPVDTSKSPTQDLFFMSYLLLISCMALWEGRLRPDR